MAMQIVVLRVLTCSEDLWDFVMAPVEICNQV